MSLDEAKNPNTKPDRLAELAFWHPQAVLDNPVLPLLLLENPSWIVPSAARAILHYLHIRQTTGLPLQREIELFQPRGILLRALADDAAPLLERDSHYPMGHDWEDDWLGRFNERKACWDIEYQTPHEKMRVASWATTEGLEYALHSWLSGFHKYAHRETQLFARGAWGQGEV